MSELADFDAAGFPVPEDLAEAVPMRRAAHLAGRICAREALRCCGAGDLRVGRGPTGAPVWPQGYRGSITHADRIAGAVAVEAGTCRGLGLDFESCMSDEAATEISGLVMCRADHDALATRTDLSFAEGATLVFSLKESLYKAISPLLGIFAGFEDAELAEIGDGRARLTLRRRLSDDLPEGTGADCVYAVEGGLVRTLAVLA